VQTQEKLFFDMLKQSFDEGSLNDVYSDKQLKKVKDYMPEPELADEVIGELLNKIISSDRIKGTSYKDRVVLPETDEEGNEIFYHGSHDGLRDGKLGAYLYVSPHPMFSAMYAGLANNADKDIFDGYDTKSRGKVFKLKVPKGRAVHFNQYTDPFFIETMPDVVNESGITDDYERVKARSENPFNYVIDDVKDLQLEDYDVAPEHIAYGKEYWEPKEMYDNVVKRRKEIASKVKNYASGGYVMKNMSGKPSMVLENEENKLLKAAEGYKGTSGIKNQLIGEAETDGLSFDEATAVVNQVLNRLKKTESGKNGGAFGTPHKATDRYRSIKSAMKEMLI
jgi:hypothetical protein